MKKRAVHIDLLRIIGLFLVIFNHTAERGFFLFAKRADSVFYFPLMVCSVFCKIAVPLFFMISGALLLKKEESLRTIFAKRVLRMVTVLLVTSVVYYLILSDSALWSISHFFKTVYSTSATTALWYLYSYIGFLLMLPLLRKLVKTMTNGDYRYLFVGHLVLTGIFPCAAYLLWQEDVLSNPSFSAAVFLESNIFFTLAGHYFENVMKLSHVSGGRRRAVIVGLSFVAVAVSCLMTHYRAEVMGVCNSAVSQVFHSSFVCVPAFGVYCLTRYWAGLIRSDRVKKVIVTLGEAVFGVYLMEKLLRMATESVWLVTSPVLGDFAASCLWVVSTMALGFGIVIVLKKIPCLNRVVNRLI